MFAFCVIGLALLAPIHSWLSEPYPLARCWKRSVSSRRSIALILAFASSWALATTAVAGTMNKCTYPDGRIEFTDKQCSSAITSTSIENRETTQPTRQNSRLAGKLKGAWIVDPKATENFVLNGTPPSNATKLAEWFGLAGGYLALFTYEFDGDSATMSAYGGVRKLEFQLLSQQGTEIKYALKNDTSSPAKTLSVFLLQDGNIKIVPSESPESSYLLWKRGALKTGQATPDDVMAVSKAWLVSIQKVVKFLRETPKATFESPISIEKENPRAALEAAIQRGTIRSATPADAQAWFNANIEKYKRNNLVPPDMSHSPLIAEVSRGNAYVVLKRFTYPPGLKDDNKAIFLLPRDVPVPDGSYGDSAIYHFYEEYFKGPSVESGAGSRW